MKKLTLEKLLLFFLFSLITRSNYLIAQTQTNKMPSLKASGYAPVNGLKMYYEVHGEGKPIVLLHGSYMAIDLNYGELIPLLAKNHKVIALEMQGHGRTADIDRAYSWDAMADDVAGLMKFLKIENADVLGYSFGATVALQTAIKYPALVNKLVFISSVYKLEGWIQEVRNIFPMISPEFFETTPLKTEYVRLAPDTVHWKAFVKKLAKFDATSFDLGAENVKKIKCPVLMIKGDNDGVDLVHTSDMYQLLGGGVSGDMKGIPASQLAIIPGTSHVSLMMATTPLMNLIDPFLNKN